MAVFFPPLALAAALWPIDMKIGWEILGANFIYPTVPPKHKCNL